MSKRAWCPVLPPVGADAHRVRNWIVNYVESFLRTESLLSGEDDGRVKGDAGQLLSGCRGQRRGRGNRGFGKHRSPPRSPRGRKCTQHKRDLKRKHDNHFPLKKKLFYFLIFYNYAAGPSPCTGANSQCAVIVWALNYLYPYQVIA